MATVRLALLLGLLGLACAGCRPAVSVDVQVRAAIPDLPQVEDQGLRQQLFTLREMVVQHAKLSEPALASDEKTAERLTLLREGFSDLETKCRAGLEGAVADKESVTAFLDHCGALMR
jgi:hypothetical protein